MMQAFNIPSPAVTITNLKSHAKTIRILHVEDEISIQEIAEKILKDIDSNLEIDATSNVNEALKKLQTGNYDAVISDYEMPQKNGLDLLRILREMKNEIPFILFTGKGREEVAIQALNLGANAYINKQGNPETVYGELYHHIKSNISHRRSELKVKENEEKFKTIFENVHDIIAYVDTHGKIIDVNSRIEEILGYKKEEIINKNFLKLKLIKPSDNFKLLKFFISAIHKEKTRNILRLDLKHKNGNKVPFEVGTRLIKDKQGKTVGVVNIFRDLSEHRKSQVALAEKELKNQDLEKTIVRENIERSEETRSLLDAANVLVQSINAEGKFVFVNEEWKKQLLYTDKDLKNISIKDVVRSDHLDKCMDVFKKVMNGLSIHDVETVFVNKNGKEILVSGNACPMFREGKFVSTVGFFVDITESKKNEERLKDSSRRIAMINEKLHVVGNLSRHDVQNKLSTITGYTYLLKKKYGDIKDVADSLGKIEQAVAESVKIFDFARMYEQLGNEDLTYIDIETKLEEAIGLFSGGLPNIISECNGLMILADSFIRQLLYNLIDNTRKYGKKTTTIRLYYKKTQDKLELIYEDDGVGIPYENKKYLCKEGFSTGGSTGFGLFFIKKMIDIYGWKIEENGEPGKGVRFTISVPKVNINNKHNYRLES